MKQQPYLKLCIFMLCSLPFRQSIAGPASEVKKDETLVFFNTSAWLNKTTDQWHIPIHGWVYEPEDSTVRKELIAAVFASTYDLSVTDSSQAVFDQRINLLLADNERNKSIVIRFANRTYALPASAANGHFKAELLVDAKVIAATNIKTQLTYQAVLPDQDSRIFSGQVNLISAKGLSIISDIDDTIKISEVTDRKQLLNHTFYLDFKAAPGMAKLYSELLKEDDALHFVSSSPWQLYPSLVTFIEKTGFLDADYALKTFRFKDSSLINLFASSLDTKPPQIIEILQKFPDRQFILVGDSGEHDPEIYAQIQQQYPQQIIKILIRNVTGESQLNSRFKNTFKTIKPKLWQLFDHPSEIKLD